MDIPINLTINTKIGLITNTKIGFEIISKFEFKSNSTPKPNSWNEGYPTLVYTGLVMPQVKVGYPTNPNGHWQRKTLQLNTVSPVFYETTSSMNLTISDSDHVIQSDNNTI